MDRVVSVFVVLAVCCDVLKCKLGLNSLFLWLPDMKLLLVGYLMFQLVVFPELVNMKVGFEYNNSF